MVNWSVVIWALPLASLVLCVLAEAWHARRCRRVAHLAFGPAGESRSWVRAAPVARALAAPAVCWGLLVLWNNDATSAAGAGDEPPASVLRHVVIALDVSPSMLVPDAGPGGDQTRAERAREVLRSLLERMDPARSRVSVVAFYTEGRPVVVDTSDPEVVANILNDLPLEHAFTAGKTRMYAAVEVADRLAQSQRWPDRTAQLVLISDGDTLPAQKPPGLPPAFGSVLIAGVGNPHRGTFIDGHSSRQDAASLQRLAAQLSGTYHDVNARHVPSDALRGFAAAGPREPVAAWGPTEWAIAAVVAGAAILALAPLLLAWFGSSWKADREGPIDALVRPGDGQSSLLLGR